MDFFEFAKETIEYAQKNGFTDCELYYSKCNNTKISVFEKEIDSYKINKSMGVGFRGIYNGKMGYTFTEILDNEAIKMMVQKAKESAQLVDNDKVEFIFGDISNYQKINSYDEEFDKTTIYQKKKIALELEEKILSLDNRIEKVAQTGYGEEYTEKSIVNSKGLKLSFKSNIACLYSWAVGNDGEIKVDAGDSIYTNKFSDIHNDKLARKIVDKVISKFGQREVESKNYKILLERNAASELLRTFINVFNSEISQKGFSKLKDMEGKKIANAIVNIVDDPHLRDGLNSMPFDDEGVPTTKKYIVKDGLLNTLLHNLKTAHKQGIRSTGNASKVDYKSFTSVSPTNCFIEKGEKSINEILEFMNEGIMITELSGLNAGSNSLTGDFSLAAKGYYIEDGKIAYPIAQSSIAGNFYDMLNNIEIIGNDLTFNSNIVSPSLYIGTLSVAGGRGNNCRF